jgi:hypothetical protein
MSSAVISTSAALGRPFIFDADPESEVGAFSADPKKPAQRQASAQESIVASIIQSKIGNRQSAIPLSPASRLEIRPAPEMASSGIPALDVLTGGLPRGCLTEICGPASSGRTSVLVAALAATTRRGEYCALIDAGDALDPYSLAAAGVDLDRLLWVRCNEESPLRHRGTKEEYLQKNGCPTSRAPLAREVGSFSQDVLNFDSGKSRVSERRLEQVLRTTDLLLESGGFGLIILDLADVPPQTARRIPLTTWFRFRRAVEHKPTILLAIEQQPIAGSCSSLLLQLGVLSTQYSVPSSNQNLLNHTADAEQDTAQNLQPAHARLLAGLGINVELIRARLDRKPPRSITFETKTAWAG